MNDRPFMYTDMSERDLLGWNLNYTMERVIAAFEVIPQDRLCVRPRPNISAPAWIFGHIVVTERFHVGWVLEGVDDVPEPFWVFRDMDPDDEKLRQAVESRQALIDYWREVRGKTESYLARITDADLKEVPTDSLLPDGDPNRQNPIREWFVMTIQHQNVHMGQLEIIAQLIEADQASA